MLWRVALVALALLLRACGLVEPQPAPTPTPVPPTPTPLPKRPEDVASAFFNAWQQAQYGAMYDLLSSDAQTATARDVFVRRHTNIRDGIGETSVAVQPGAF